MDILFMDSFADHNAAAAPLGAGATTRRRRGGIRTRALQQNDNDAVPRVSVVTVAYNAEKTIEETILSVLDLQYENIEYIIIDGGSTDGTLDIVNKYEEKIHLWISEPDKGIYDGMNKGIQEASGEWINFMNCGDRFAGSGALNFFKRQQFSEDVLYGEAVIQYPEFQTPYRKTPLNEMWKRMPFCHQATFARTALMQQRNFDLRYRLSSDFDFLYKSYLDGRKFGYVKELICIFDFVEGASIKHVFQSARERKRIVLAQSFSVQKWLYHTLVIGYIYSAVYIKKIVGVKMTNFLTKVLRRKRTEPAST